MSGPLTINVPTSDAKTTIPFFQENTYAKFRLAKINQEEVKDKGNVIKFEFDLVDPAANQDGGTILPGQLGAKVFVNVQDYDKNTKTGDPMPKWAVEKIAKIQDALLGTGDVGNAKNKPARPAFNGEVVPSMIGQTCLMKFKNKTGDYVGQDVSAFAFPGDVAGAQ